MFSKTGILPETAECSDDFLPFQIFIMIDHHKRPVDLCFKTDTAYIYLFVCPYMFVSFFRSGERKIILVKGYFPSGDFYGKAVRSTHRFHHHHGSDLSSGMFDHVGGKFRKSFLTGCFNRNTGTQQKYEGKKKTDHTFAE